MRSTPSLDRIGSRRLGLYVETMPDPKAFQEAVNVARELGKPIVAIKTGRSEVAQKMVVSHTASLAGSDVLVSALFERLGVARVDSLEALMEALKVLHVLGPLNGGRIGAMSTSGGDLTLLADGHGPKPDHAPAVRKGDPTSSCDGTRADGGCQSVRFPDVRLE